MSSESYYDHLLVISKLSHDIYQIPTIRYPTVNSNFLDFKLLVKKHIAFHPKDSDVILIFREKRYYLRKLSLIVNSIYFSKCLNDNSVLSNTISIAFDKDWNEIPIGMFSSQNNACFFKEFAVLVLDNPLNSVSIKSFERVLRLFCGMERDVYYSLDQFEQLILIDNLLEIRGLHHLLGNTTILSDPNDHIVYRLFESRRVVLNRAEYMDKYINIGYFKSDIIPMIKLMQTLESLRYTYCYNIAFYSLFYCQIKDKINTKSFSVIKHHKFALMLLNSEESYPFLSYKMIYDILMAYRYNSKNDISIFRESIINWSLHSSPLPASSGNYCYNDSIPTDRFTACGLLLECITDISLEQNISYYSDTVYYE